MLCVDALLVSATAWLIKVLLIASAATVQKNTFLLDKLNYFLELMSVHTNTGAHFHDCFISKSIPKWDISLVWIFRDRFLVFLSLSNDTEMQRSFAVIGTLFLLFSPTKKVSGSR